MPLDPHTRLGPYEIVAPAGAGGMGEVYRARDTRLGRDVAIKVLPARFASDPELRQRLGREARAVSSLSHPNICALYDVGHQDGIDFLVMEDLEGETLATRLTRGALPLDQVLRHGIEIADALTAAHRKGIVHRDLKPGNVMLTPTGARLLDFGLAKPASSTHAAGPAHADLTASAPITSQGSVIGTFQYMSPGQVEGRDADARSDIFALGAVLHEMATGKRAFDGMTTTSVMAAILERDPPPISSLQPLSPLALDDLVRGCLAKDPDERWQTAHGVKLQLQALRRHVVEPGAQPPLRDDRSAGSSCGRSPRWRWWPRRFWAHDTSAPRRCRSRSCARRCCRPRRTLSRRTISRSHPTAGASRSWPRALTASPRSGSSRSSPRRRPRSPAAREWLRPSGRTIVAGLRSSRRGSS